MKANVIEAMGEKLTIVIGTYHNLRTAISLVAEDHEPFATISTNIAHAELSHDEFCLQSWNMPAELISDLKVCGKFEDTGRTVETGMVEAPIWKITCPEMLQAAAGMREKFEAMANGGQCH